MTNISIVDVVGHAVVWGLIPFLAYCLGGLRLATSAMYCMVLAVGFLREGLFYRTQDVMAAVVLTFAAAAFLHWIYYKKTGKYD